jgi:hypothetical protein
VRQEQLWDVPPLSELCKNAINLLAHLCHYIFIKELWLPVWTITSWDSSKFGLWSVSAVFGTSRCSGHWNLELDRYCTSVTWILRSEVIEMSRCKLDHQSSVPNPCPPDRPLSNLSRGVFLGSQAVEAWIWLHSPQYSVEVQNKWNFPSIASRPLQTLMLRQRQIDPVPFLTLFATVKFGLLLRTEHVVCVC